MRRVMAPKLTRLTHRIAMQLHLVEQNCITCSSRSRRPVRQLFDTPSHISYIRQGENRIMEINKIVKYKKETVVAAVVGLHMNMYECCIRAAQMACGMTNIRFNSVGMKSG